MYLLSVVIAHTGETMPVAKRYTIGCLSKGRSSFVVTTQACVPKEIFTAATLCRKDHRELIPFRSIAVQTVVGVPGSCPAQEIATFPRSQFHDKS